MIAQIFGKVSSIADNSLIMDVNGICYEVMIPVAILQRVKDSLSPEKTLRLITYHYLQVEPSRSIPVLIGFTNSLEKDFFELFISVSGIGPRAAVKALDKSISAIAEAIRMGDEPFLTTLPGIGKQRARDIVARLQDKIARFCLLKDGVCAPLEKDGKSDIVEEALLVLERLQYKKQEAADMIDKALKKQPGLSTVEDILNAVYLYKNG